LGIGQNTGRDGDVPHFPGRKTENVPSVPGFVQFVFTAGPKNETGALTWNANGTLKTLAITDGFNAGGTQTCHFNPSDATGTGYDDVVRLVGVDCGSGQWGQTFSYDQYDNLTKTVISGRIGSTYNPGYSSTTNHCSICTYDSDGNVTSDGSNNYGWSEFAKLKWTATSGTPTCGSSGECITYDAFGRMVENSSGGAYTELWITQLGTIVQMAGATPNYAYFPAPEGGTAIINGNSSSYGYLHKDWRGSARIVSNVVAHGATVDQAFSPYGEIYDQFGSTSSPYDMFAEITQNFAPGVMWDTPNRELSVVGRWLSPDPVGQGWNRYAYATNPLNFVDPSGLQLIGPYRCSGRGPNTCPGAGMDPDALDPTGGGGGGIWSGTISGVLNYQWLAGDPATQPVVIGWDDDGNLIYGMTVGAGYWQLSDMSFGASGSSDAANNSTWQWIKNTARKIGSYIPTPCGGGVYNYGGLQVSNGVSSVAVSQIRVADSREGYLQGPFGEFGYGEGIVGGVGQAQFNNANETFFFAGAGGDLSVVGANLSAFGTSTGSFGYNLEGEIGPFKGGVGIYQNVDSLTSCLDHGGH
jgi:hypothetical protein